MFFFFNFTYIFIRILLAKNINENLPTLLPKISQFGNCNNFKILNFVKDKDLNNP